jgi:hypothetical protein
LSDSPSRAGRAGPTGLSPSNKLLGRSDRSDGLSLAESLKSYWDWHARLNHVLNAGSLPPQPRLALNAALFGRRLWPSEVELTLHFGPTRRLRTIHQVTWSLQPEDYDRLEQTRRQLKTARFVPLADFLAQTTKP